MLPGGIGTLDELFDLWAKIQLGVENKKLILVDVNSYYSRLLLFLKIKIPLKKFNIPIKSHCGATLSIA